MEESKNKSNNMSKIEELRNQSKQYAFDSVYRDKDNKYFREVLLRRIIALEIKNRRDEKINQIINDEE